MHINSPTVAAKVAETKRLIQMLKAEGYTRKQCAQWLNACGYRNATGGLWQQSSLSRYY